MNKVNNFILFLDISSYAWFHSVYYQGPFQ